MSDWKRYKFLDICHRLVNGGTPDTSNPSYWNGNIPWITGADFNEHGISQIRRKINENAFRSSSTNIIEKDNLLLVTRTGVGKLAIAPFDIAISQDITGIYFSSEIVDTLFMYYSMQSLLVELQKLNQGTSINGILRDDLENLEVDIPSLPHQRKIAKILSTVDEQIEQTEALIAKYQSMKKGMMQDLFSRGVDKNGKLRPSYETASNLYKSSELGMIPKEWEIKTVANSEVLIIDGDRGVHYPHEDEFSSDGYCIFLSATNVTKDGFRFDTIQFITKDKDELLRKGKLQKFDIVVTTRGTVGNVAFYNDTIKYENIRINSGMVILRNQGKDLQNAFLYYSIKEWLLPVAQRKTASGSAQPQFPIKDLEKMYLIKPKLFEQKIIAEKIHSITLVIENEKEWLSKLKQQKQGLMQDLLTGNLPVAV